MQERNRKIANFYIQWRDFSINISIELPSICKINSLPPPSHSHSGSVYLDLKVVKSDYLIDE